MSLVHAVTDLDGTVVFAGPPDPSTVSLEIYASGRHGQMARDSYEAWKRLAQTGRLVVSTTRTPVQLARLLLPASVHLALASNGYRLLVDGVEDEAWRGEVTRALRRDSAPAEEVLPMVESIVSSDPELRWARSDDYLFTVVTDTPERLSPAGRVISGLVMDLGWRTATVHRKLYVFPAGLDKGSLVEAVMTREGISRWVAGGDSTMDASMVGQAEAGIVPRDSDLERGGLDSSSVEITQSAGVYAGVEVMAFYERHLAIAT